MSANLLDDSIYAASKELRGRGAPDPEVLFLMGTGMGLLPSVLNAAWRLPLESVAGVPAAWRNATLVAADSGAATFWFIEDAPGERQGRLGPASDAPPWERAFPVWLAACSGATLCVHTSAGSRLQSAPDEVAQPALGIGRDHLNLSGSTPLFGLGESRLGPLFPDQTTVHHPFLRQRALSLANERGIAARESVLACTAGPTLETPAEREYYARAGADVAVQNLAGPLIAASHAGLACLAVVALLEDSGELDVARLLEGAESVAPALDELLEAMIPDLARVSLELREEA
jgi:purine-nucleoside phosphorylase